MKFTQIKFLVLGFLFLLLAVGVATAAWLTREKPNKGHLIYDTILHDDGSKEHRLINSGLDEVRGNDDDQHWVLRLPKYVQLRSREDSIRLKTLKEPHIHFTYNKNVSINFRYPNPETYVDFETNLDDIVTVHLDSDISRYGNLSKPISKQDFAWKLEVRSNRRCRLDKEVFPGVILLRDPTQTEVKKMFAEFGKNVPSWKIPSWDEGCDDPFKGHSYYLVNNENGQTIAWGNCRGADILADPRATCSFSVWIQPGRVIIFRLPNKFLPELRDIFGYVETLLQSSTVLQESRNINFNESMK